MSEGEFRFSIKSLEELLYLLLVRSDFFYIWSRFCTKTLSKFFLYFFGLFLAKFLAFLELMLTRKFLILAPDCSLSFDTSFILEGTLFSNFLIIFFSWKFSKIVLASFGDLMLFLVFYLEISLTLLTSITIWLWIWFFSEEKVLFDFFIAFSADSSSLLIERMLIFRSDAFLYLSFDILLRVTLLSPKPNDLRFIIPPDSSDRKGES